MRGFLRHRTFNVKLGIGWPPYLSLCNRFPLCLPLMSLWAGKIYFLLSSHLNENIDFSIAIIAWPPVEGLWVDNRLKKGLKLGSPRSSFWQGCVSGKNTLPCFLMTTFLTVASHRLSSVVQRERERKRERRDWEREEALLCLLTRALIPSWGPHPWIYLTQIISQRHHHFFFQIPSRTNLWEGDTYTQSITNSNSSSATYELSNLGWVS